MELELGRQLTRAEQGADDSEQPPGRFPGTGRVSGVLDREHQLQTGVSPRSLTRTADGFEMNLGTNHLGHFALTNLLLPQVTGRVVTVASQAERMARLDLDDLNWEHRPYAAAAHRRPFPLQPARR